MTSIYEFDLSGLSNVLSVELFGGEDIDVKEIDFVKCFYQLPKEVQQALYLRYYRNYKMMAVANELKLSLNKTVNSIHEGKVILRRKLFPGYYIDPLRKNPRISGDV